MGKPNVPEWGRFFPLRVPQCTAEEAATVFGPEAEQDLIQTSLRLAKRRIRNQKQSHPRGLWDQVEEAGMEQHEKRVRQIRLFFHQKRTGLPF